MSASLASFPVNDVPCGGPLNEHDGCQLIFPYSDSARKLCFKCTKLSDPNLSESDRLKTEAFKSCQKCGLTGRNIANPCGTCTRRDLESEGLEDPVKEAARRARADKAQSMFHLHKPKPMMDLTNHPVGPTTPAQELSEIRISNKSACWTIIYTVRVDNRIDNRFGVNSYSADADETLLDVLDEILKHVNLKWTKLDGNFVSLTAKYCELGFKNNFRISPEAVTFTVKGLYQFYAARSDRALALGKDSTKTKGLAKGTFMEMEVLVSNAEYLKSVQHFAIDDDDDDSDIVEVSSTGKRKKKNQDKMSLTKRLKTQVVLLKSSFTPGVTYSGAPGPSGAPVDAFAFIKFTIIDCVIDPDTGVATLDEARSVKTGKISKSPLSGVRQIDLGKSKDVFKLTMTGVPGTYVAKFFFDVGRGRGNGLEANEVLLLHDLVRLKRLALFRDQFMQTARDTNTEVS
ncbi:hypothetical protein K438DRAFT_2017448, partial [Mycena galopus ATCC 62051]